MSKVFIVAEIGASHNGSLERALETVEAAAAAGADAVKVQCYTADTMVADRSYVLQSGPWAGRNLHALYAEGAMPWDWIAEVFVRAKAKGMVGFASPFDENAVAYLESIGCPIYKVASFEVTDIPLIKRIAVTGKPIMLSTGMASIEEIDDAIESCPLAHVTLLKCTSAYPAPLEEMNLAAIADMGKRFNCDVGLSDHSDGYMAAVMAIALGASVIEKHVTITDDGGLDDRYALTAPEFKQFVYACRQAEQALGSAQYGPTPSEASSLALRRGLYAVRDIVAGEALTAANVKARRPSACMPPRALDFILGTQSKRAVLAGEAIDATML